MRLSVFTLGVFLTAASAFADTTTVQVGRCHVGTVDFGLYLETGDVLTSGANLNVVSGEVSTKTGLNPTVGGVYDPVKGQITLPSYWRPDHLSLKDCQFQAPIQPAAFHGPLQDIRMALLAYFVYGSVRAVDDIDTLVRNQEAIPINVQIVCRTDKSEPPPVGCHEVVILDRIIPVDPHAGGARFTFAALAAPAPPSSLGVVQLESSVCGMATKIQAQGTLVEWQGQTLVLTSAGAIQSDLGSNSCTEAVGPLGERWPLTLRRHDYEWGLASLTFNQRPPFTGINLSLVKRSGLPDQLRVQTALATTPVEALATSSTRHFIPRAARAIETLGGIFDSKVMGAALLDDQGGLAGLASHEYLKIFPGSLTRPLRWSPSGHEISDHLIFIGADDLNRWLSNPSVSALWPNPIDPTRVQSGQLEFSENCPPLDGSKGGGDYPIGGGDAVGIGGDPTNYRACKIDVRLATRPAATPALTFFNPALQAWHDRLAKILGRGQTVELDFKLLPGDIWGREYFYSSESFLRGITTGTPIMLEILGGGTADPKLQNLRALARSEESIARDIYLNYTFNDPEIETLIRRAYFVARLAQSEQWAELRPEHFAELADPVHTHAWGMITWLARGGKKFQDQVEALHQARLLVQP